MYLYHHSKKCKPWNLLLISIQCIATISKLVFGKHFCTFSIYDTNFHSNFHKFEIHRNFVVFEIKAFEIQILPHFQNFYASKIICFTENVWWYMFGEVKVVKSFWWSWRVYVGKSLLIYQTISPPNFSATLQCLCQMKKEYLPILSCLFQYV